MKIERGPLSEQHSADSDLDGIVHYLYELGLLKRQRRTGWWVAGIVNPESVAEHSFRAAVIGYLLGLLEGADPMKTALMALFHDVHETRIGDLHRLNSRYLESADAQQHAALDQISLLPKEVSRGVTTVVHEFFSKETPEAMLARDADLLECLIQAREYQAQGCSSVAEWIQDAYGKIQSGSAKRLAELFMKIDPKQWWHRIKTDR